jgi:hypothetical protein
MTTAGSITGDAIMRADARRARIIMPFALIAACGVGLAAGSTKSGGKLVLVGVAGALVSLAIWKWRHAGVIMLLAVATTVEQFKYSAGTHAGVFTDRIPLFASVTKGSGISPFELIVGLILVAWIMRGALVHNWNTPRSSVAKALMVFMFLVVVAVGVGMAHGGKSQVILYEVRPWVYLATTYLLASALLHRASTMRAILWTIVLGTGFKSVQGVIMYLQTRHQSPRPEAILGHEESFFFGIFLILTLALWLFGVEGRLRTLATVLTPFVLLADMANARRTAWVTIGLTLALFFAIAYSALPERRRAIRRGALIVLVFSAVYTPVFWNNPGLLGQPARALHAQISPDARDKSSNLYRVQEDANLEYNIRQSASIGKGFGPLIKYVLPITDISKIDNFITFLPHDSVLDMWMRMGIQGMVVFLMLLAAAIIRASALIRRGDKELAVIGILTVCAVMAYVVQGSVDLGFFWFRIALCLGTLLGAVEAGHRMADHRATEPAEVAVREAEPAPARVAEPALAG